MFFKKKNIFETTPEEIAFQNAKKKAKRVRGISIDGGALLGLLIGWVTRPSSVLMGKISLQDYYKHFNEIYDDSVGGEYLQEITIHLAIFVVIGVLVGFAFSTLINKINEKPELSKDNSLKL